MNELYTITIPAWFLYIIIGLVTMELISSILNLITERQKKTLAKIIDKNMDLINKRDKLLNKPTPSDAREIKKG